MIVACSSSPQLYERSAELCPKRWLDRAGGLTPTEMAQFGGGPHFCLGYHLAWLEIVQFPTGLALSAGDRRPRLCGPFAGPRYLPLLHPAASMRVTFS